MKFDTPFLGKLLQIAILVVCGASLQLTAPSTMASEAAVKEFHAAAYSGKFKDGIDKLGAISKADRGDVEAMFGLGALQFFAAIADLQKALHDHATLISTKTMGGGWASGLMPFGQGMGGFMLVPPNPQATPMTYALLRENLVRFEKNISAAERTLSQVGERAVKVPFKPFDIAIDLDHNGAIEQHERILVNLLGGARQRMREAAFGAELAFDTADASWLRGYSHVVLATVNFLLAFDFERSYDVAAHNLYGDEATSFGRLLASQAGLGRPRDVIEDELEKVRNKLSALRRERSSNKDIRELRKHIDSLPDTPKNAEQRKLLGDALKTMETNQTRHREERTRLYQEQRRLNAEMHGSGMDWIFDAIAMVHTLSWDVVEPGRLKAVRQHLLNVMDINIKTWALARQETDDDREWLPNAKQTAPFGSQPIGDDVIDSWLATTALAAQILKGEKLLPHPRFKKGVNLRKIFDTAKRLDFVLLTTGHDLIPYLEDGEVVDEKAWSAITQPMGRHVGNYALWFN
jgi:hypothetical protein